MPAAQINPAKPRPYRSVMLSPNPSWKPEYEQEPGLETVDPTDLIPSKASIAATIAALKSAPMLAGATFPIMNKARLQRLLEENAYGNNDGKSKAGLSWVTPNEFLGSTTTGHAHRQRIAEEAGRFDPYKFINQQQHPFLRIDPMAGQVTGHESRHRLTALSESMEGNPKVPVLTMAEFGQGMPASQIAALRARPNKGQQYGQAPQGQQLPAGQVVPLTYGTPKEQLDQFITNVDVPLTRIGIALKPEGALATAEALRAYRKNIPFGKIPPPIPRSNP